MCENMSARTAELDLDMRVPSGFSALGDPARIWLVQEMAARGFITPTQAARELGMTRQGATRHLDALCAAGLATSRQAGRSTEYVLRSSALAELGDWLWAIRRR
ncbi:MAG: ArsR family transcriptional regulator [Armatimonadetes bacterium]|nr:ArsR family transcriptional regulator [Armatimonadota bacterium]